MRLKKQAAQAPPKRRLRHRSTINTTTSLYFIFLSLIAFGLTIAFFLHTRAVDSGRNILVNPPLKLTRGEHGLPIEETPALIGSKRGHIECDTNVDHLAYWNDPQGERDIQFRSPFNTPPLSQRYVTFEPDRGGWNNVRISFENMVVFAAATGRILVLPPDQPLYLLKLDKGRIHRGFADFFDLQTEALKKRVKIITASQFVKTEGITPNGLLPVPSEQKEKVMSVLEGCEHRAKSSISCFFLYNYYREKAKVPPLHATKDCLIFDASYFHGFPIDDESQKRLENFCQGRKPYFYDRILDMEPVIHFSTSEKQTRILCHFYAFIHFTNPNFDNFYKRFIRDSLHYRSEIFCAAGKIIRALQLEGRRQNNGFTTIDSEGGGGYSSMHIRRGDFQWKDMRISGQEWYDNTREHFNSKEILYIATDEDNQTFFDPITSHYNVKFLHDFREVAGLDNIDPNWIGMIETIVASRGRVFVGTYFSSFTGYISRMRGYHGMSGRQMWYGHNKRKNVTHAWVDFPECASREYPVGWIGIDGDTEVTADQFF